MKQTLPTDLGSVGPVLRLRAEQRVKRAVTAAEILGDRWVLNPYDPETLENFRAATDELDNALACASELGVDPGILERA